MIRDWLLFNQQNENLPGVAIRCGQDQPDEYGKLDGQEIKRGVITHAYHLQDSSILSIFPTSNLQILIFPSKKNITLLRFSRSPEEKMRRPEIL